MKYIAFSLLMLMVISNSHAQEPGKVVEIVKGKVINSVTSEEVSYTNIGIEGTFYGTASNSEGNFELKIPEEMKNSTIFFSAVGFVNKKIEVNTLFEKEFNIVKIDPQSYDIDDIDVAAQSKVLVRILTMASENIPYNFISGPFNLQCSYTKNKTINDTTTIEQKAEILIYDQDGYSNPSKLDAFRSIKYSLKKEAWEDDYSFSSGTTNMDEILELDWVRSASSVLNPEILKSFSLKLEDEPVVDGKLCWLISFKQEHPTLAGSGNYYSNKFSGKITITKEDYSVLKIEGNAGSTKNSRQGNSLAIGNSNMDAMKNVNYNFQVIYENLKPAVITMEKNYELGGDKIAENTALKINRVLTTNVTPLASREYFSGE